MPRSQRTTTTQGAQSHSFARSPHLDEIEHMDYSTGSPSLHPTAAGPPPGGLLMPSHSHLLPPRHTWQHPLPKVANSPCRFLPPLPPITRNVKLPIPANPLQFRVHNVSPLQAKSKSGKNGNVHHASQLSSKLLHPLLHPLLSAPPPRPLRPLRFNSPLLRAPHSASVSSVLVLVVPSPVVHSFGMHSHPA